MSSRDQSSSRQMVTQIPRKIRLFRKFPRTYLRNASVPNETLGYIQCLPAKKMTNSAAIKTFSLLTDLFENSAKHIAHRARWRNINKYKVARGFIKYRVEQGHAYETCCIFHRLAGKLKLD